MLRECRRGFCVRRHGHWGSYNGTSIYMLHMHRRPAARETWSATMYKVSPE